jgi:hypothetical protein
LSIPSTCTSGAGTIRNSHALFQFQFLGKRSSLSRGTKT